MKLLRWFTNESRSSPSLLLAGLVQARGPTVHWGQVLRTLGILPALFILRTTREEVYNVLWTLVFAFATLNILSLGARRFEQSKTGLSFGEVLAILVVLVSIVLLGWELLYVFHILPIRFTPN